MKRNWHDNAFWGIHFDWHARPEDREIGRYMTREYMIDFLRELRPDWIQVDCKGHPGICSWPTRVGRTPDGLETDPLKACSEAAAELNIPLGIHYSGVIDDTQMKLHPGWAVQDAAGVPDEHSSCCSGAYTEFMIAHLKEVLSRYRISGIWVDGECWGAKLCWCRKCREQFRREYGISTPEKRTDPGWAEFLEFHRQRFVRHVQRYAEAIHADFPEVLVCSNWMYSARMPDSVTAGIDYLSGDFDPSWGAARAATEARMFDARKRDFRRSWDLMLWSFAYSFDSPAPAQRAAKPLVQMRQEATEVLAHGGAVMLYDQPERNGHIPAWKRRRYRELKEWCELFRADCSDTVSASPVAVLHTATHMREFPVGRAEYCDDQQLSRLFDHTAACRAMEGALHFALESGFSCDIITEDSLNRLAQYRLLIVPEHVAIAPAVFDALREYVNTGGHVLFTGSRMGENVQRLLGITLHEAPADTIAYAQVDDEILPLPRWARVVDMEQEIFPLRYALSGFCPECNRTAEPLATVRNLGCGEVSGIYGDIFRDYFLGHNPTTRRFLVSLLETWVPVMPYALAERGKRPWIELVARRQNEDLLLHIINRGARETLSSYRPIVGEVCPLGDVEIEFASELAGRRISCVAGSEIRRRGTWLTVANVDIYEIVRVYDYFPAPRENNSRRLRRDETRLPEAPDHAVSVFGAGVTGEGAY